MRPRAWIGLVMMGALVGGLGCPPDDPSDDGGTSGGDAGGGAMLGCPSGQTCRLVLVSQTLDDRVEIFAPGDPDGAVYRGAIDLDLKPNACDGCTPGDYGDGRLDEPFGLVRAGGFLHVLAGHYPQRERGTLLSFPLDLFADRSAGDTIAVGEYFDGAAFAGVIETPLAQLEPIYLTAHRGKLLIGTFNNDFFTAESQWTEPGRLLVLDASDPAAGVGVVDLGALQDGSCNGAGEVIVLDDDHVAVACDGNDGVAVLDVSGIEASPSEAAATIGGRVCSIGTGDKRVRHLAPDGAGGFVVAESPGMNLFDGARLWSHAGDCTLNAFQMLMPAGNGDFQIGNIVALPGHDATWLFAAGSAIATGTRGIFVAHGPALELCGPIAGFDQHLIDPQGDPLEPFGLAATRDGKALVVTAGPFIAQEAAAGYGKVLWAELSGESDPCTMTATVTDLTAGGPTAPPVAANDPSTWRRAPNVITLHELGD